MMTEYYPYVVSLIQFFLLAAFSMQLCLGLTVYMEFVEMKGVHYPELKLATMGWAIPMIVVGATLAAQVPEGFRLNSWWIQMQTNYFYAFSISVIIITGLQIMLVMTVKSELKMHKKLETSRHSKSVNRSQLLNRSLVIIFFLLLVSASSIMYINFEDEMYKYAFSSSSGGLGFMIFLCYTVCSENAHSLCSSSQTIEDEDEKEEPTLKARNGSFEGFLKPEIVSDTYCTHKLPSETIEVDVRMEKLRKLRFQMSPDEIDHLLTVDKSITVHRPLGAEPQWATAHAEAAGDRCFQLQQLDDSPRSSQFHPKDEEEEQQPRFYELTPPDILEPAVRTTPDPSSCALPGTGSSYSTFRPPAEEGQQKEAGPPPAKSPSPSKRQKPLKVPDIGDEPIVEAGTLKKKEGLGMQVATPVVPPLDKDAEQAKKGWSITTV